MSKERFHFQLKSVRGMVIKSMDEIDDSLIEVIPAGYNNNLLWHFGHIATFMEGEIIRLTGKDSSVKERFDKYFDNGTSPADFDDDTPDKEEIRKVLESHVDEYSQVSQEKLDEELDEEFLGITRSDDLSAFMILHEALHEGKIQSMAILLNEQY
ncbi:DinB family protein [Lacicoccus qingdaonensis]|uniref:DinB superfamily protein n=1 Tax=Lacicoccus qingdaonensis TaxID=576118 RepID=A0A1G9FIS6_9BACL|nr:DinB family protein [Salinicoccus qingdaonensis]SDK88289.1 DinB superfamily protein [Salinicoccus qingdaonensis]